MQLDPTRLRPLTSFKYSSGSILYWMGRDQRVADNWGLLSAQAIASKQGVAFAVVFVLPKTYLEATIRQYDFLLQGLEEVDHQLSTLGIAFYIAIGSPDLVIPDLVTKWRIGCLVTDFLPLEPVRTWKLAISSKLNIPFYEVDAHNIVPVWIASAKQEFGAYTLRPKLRSLWPKYLTEFPALLPQRIQWPHDQELIDWKAIRSSISVSYLVPKVTWIISGSLASNHVLAEFITERIPGYASNRNKPGLSALSELSPYFHFGQLAPQRAALAVQAADAPDVDKEAYLEELLVRRELADNFCFYSKNYADLSAAPAWAQRSLMLHKSDFRPITYSLEALETAATHDELWNAAQLEMLKRGKMHGYMRMYWAKKILEWSQSPEDALRITTYLNDKYFLDGRDPNGYAGILWAIAGLHDRPWVERSIFGQIRYMNYNGAKRKFDIQAYVSYVNGLPDS